MGTGISERSGFRYPLKEMIREPGTNLLIHPKESDGIYNRVTHPLLYVTKNKRFDDPKPLKNISPPNYGFTTPEQLNEGTFGESVQQM